MTDRVPANKGRRYPAEVLTDAEVEALIGVCSSRAPTGIRNRALIAVMRWCGLRITEALDLYPKDVDLQAGTIRILHGKGDKARTVGVGQTAAAFLARWMDQRAKLGLNGRQVVFCTLKGEPMESAYVRALMPRLARKAGIDKRVHAHGLRHTHAASLAKANIPLNVIQAQLGHSNVATTSRYLAHVAPQQVINAIKELG